MKIDLEVAIIVLVVIILLNFAFFFVFFLNLDNETPRIGATPPQYVQTIPIERYPGMQCYVIVTPSRHTVLSHNCHTVYVQSDTITIGNYVIPRQTPGARCDRCYLSDYMNILGFLLFGRPNMGIPPPAPKGLLLLEDDAIICNSALSLLDKCFYGQYNCILGNGAWANFYAGAETVQPDTRFAKNRFTSIDELIQDSLDEDHADYYIRRAHNRHAFAVFRVNHVGETSTLSHHNGKTMKCKIEDSLAGNKTLVNRHKDARLVRPVKD